MSSLPHCWGVGLARTGNTSLCAALRLLGYDAVRQDPTFEQLRDLQGASGNTTVLHFKYLDYVFPGSKFVLTTRPVQDWLGSMEHSHIHDPRPIFGEHERIARRMAIYGHVGYDEPIMAGAFQRHHAEVRRYFTDRPDDLLEMNLTGGQGWDALCPFLGLAQPSQPFPMLNAGTAA